MEVGVLEDVENVVELHVDLVRFATLAATDLRRAIGEHIRKRACVHVLWVACTRECAGDSAATGVRHFAGIKEF